MGRKRRPPDEISREGMTFDRFCLAHEATPEERGELLDFLAFLRFRDLLEWWEQESQRSRTHA